MERREGSGLLLRCRERRAGLLAAMVMGGGPRPSTMWGTLRFLSDLNLFTLHFERMNLLDTHIILPFSLLTPLSYAFSRLFQTAYVMSHVTSRGTRISGTGTTSRTPETPCIEIGCYVSLKRL